MRLVDTDELAWFTIPYGRDINIAVVLKRDIDSAPTIDAEPVRHGKWESEISYCFSNDEYPLLYIYFTSKCSECGAEHHYYTAHYNSEDDLETNVYDYIKMATQEVKSRNISMGSLYCPDCGTKMDKKEQSNEQND